MLFTPFKDKRLLKLLECDSKVIVDQVTDGKLSKLVIEYFNKDLLQLLDKSKNNADPKWFWQADAVKEKFDYENDGRLEKDSKLYRASWLINKFAYALAPIRPVVDNEIDSFINTLPLQQLRQDINIENLGGEFIKWINKSKRVHIENNTQSSINLLGGIDYCIESLCNRFQKIGYLPDSYYGVKDYCTDKGIEHYSISDEVIEGSAVVIELPTPNHDMSTVLKFLNECKKKSCYVALDMTFLPVYIGEHLKIDLNGIDEVWFSMNKTWPISDLRPSLRYSNTKINDMHQISQSKNAHNKVVGNVLKHCIKQFNFDYTFDKHIDAVKSICDTFDLQITNNLWLGYKKNIIWKHMPSANWNYNNLIGLHGLIENKSQFFW